MSVQRISSFKTFTELKGQQVAAKLHEEGKAKRAEIVSKIGAALEEMGVTSLQELDEEKRNSLISKIFNEDRAEDIEDKIVGMGKPEEENPEKGANLTNESVINEGTRSQVGKIDKAGKITSVYVHWDGYPENMVPLVKNYDKKKLDQLIKLGKAGISYLDKEIGDKPMDFSNPTKGITLFYGRDRGEKGNMEAKGDVKNLVKYLKDVSNKAGAEYVYLYDEKDGKWYMADAYEDKELKPVAESFLMEGNAFGAAVIKAKEAGEEEFEVNGKKYKVKEDNSSELDAINDVFEANYNVSRDAVKRMDGLHNIKQMKSFLDCAAPIIEDFYGEGFEYDEIIGYLAFKIADEFDGVYEGEERKTVEVSEKKSTKEDLLDKIEKLRLDSNAGKITGDQFMDQFFPLWKELKSLYESIVEEDLNEARSINKIQTEWTKVTNAMKATAAEWKAAEGDAKSKLLDTLKQMTAQKKALEAELDAVVADKDKDLELAIESLEINEGFEVHYSDGVRAMKKFGNEKQAMDFAKDLIKNKKGLQFVDVFNAGSGFHSTADTDAIVAFWGDGSYTDNVAKKDSKLAAKKMNESTINEEDIKSDEDFKEYAMIVLKKAFGADFDEAKAQEAIDGILKKCDGDYGACVGMLTSSLGESATNEALKATKPNEVTTVEVDMAWDDSDPEDDKAAKAAFKKFKIKVKGDNGQPGTYEVTGKKKDILAYLQSEFYEMDDETVEEFYPELLEGNSFEVYTIENIKASKKAN